MFIVFTPVTCRLTNRASLVVGEVSSDWKKRQRKALYLQKVSKRALEALEVDLQMSARELQVTFVLFLPRCVRTTGGKFGMHSSFFSDSSSGWSD